MAGFKSVKLIELNDIHILDIYEFVKNDMIVLGETEEISDEKKSAFIERLILQLPIEPIILMNNKNDDTTLYSVLSGANEIKIIIDFLDGKFSLKNSVIDEESFYMKDDNYLKLNPIAKRHFTQSKYFKVYNLVYEIEPYSEEDIQKIMKLLHI